MAGHVGGILGAGLAHLARSAFVSGMDLGLTVSAAAALAGCLLALAALPSRPASGAREDAGGGRPASTA